MGACGESSLSAVATIRCASWDDLEAVFGLLHARGRAAFGTSDMQLRHVRSTWESPSFEVGRDNWVAVDDGKIVGYAGLGPTMALDHAARDADVGDGLLARVEERGRERGFGRVTATVVPQDEPLYALVRRNGFELEREISQMWKPLDGELAEAAWPDGVAVRPYTDE